MAQKQEQVEKYKEIIRKSKKLVLKKDQDINDLKKSLGGRLHPDAAFPLESLALDRSKSPLPRDRRPVELPRRASGVSYEN